MVSCCQMDLGIRKDVTKCIEMIKELLGKVPIFGICLGHQLFALASGGKYSKIEIWSSWVKSPSKRFANRQSKH